MLFRAETLTGAWRLHPASPITADVRWSRNGGAVRREGSRLLRVSQCGSPAYGYGLTLHRIDACSESEYRESAWRSVRPTWRPTLAGVHTYNATAGVEVIDVRTQRGVRRHGRRLRPAAALGAWASAR
jgi:hypothetical protein